MTQQYLEHSRFILSDNATGYKPNRTDADSLSRFGYRNEYDLRKGFPLLTTKEVRMSSIIHELIWFMRGDTNIKYLVNNNVHIWDDNAFDHFLIKQGKKKKFAQYSPDWKEAKKRYIARIQLDSDFAQEHGDLGPVYGKQWRHWKTRDGKTIDQFGQLIERLQKSPTSRRHIITAWNPEDVDAMALPPCHCLYQFNVQDTTLDCQLYQRSCDMFLGVPFNIASYALLTQIVAQQAQLEPRFFMHAFGDAHFYCGKGARGAFYGANLNTLKNKINLANAPEHYGAINRWIEINAPREEGGEHDHIPKILEQLAREPRSLPTMRIAKKPFDQLTIEDFVLEGYDPHPPIRAAMAV